MSLVSMSHVMLFTGAISRMEISNPSDPAYTQNGGKMLYPHATVNGIDFFREGEHTQ